MKKFNLLFLTLLFFSFAKAQNVGIGLNNPAAKLHVKGGTGLLILETEFGASQAGPHLDFKISDEAGGVGSIAYIAESYALIEGTDAYRSKAFEFRAGGAARLNFVTASTSFPKMTILNDGKVGIGTATPLSGFHLNSTFRYTPSGSTPTAGNVLTADADGVATWQAAAVDTDWLKTDGSSPTAITDNIYTNGNVGVGTTSVADGSLNVQSNDQEAYGYKSHIVYEDSDGADPLNVVYSSKTVNTASLGTWYNLNVGARISVVNFCIQATTGNDAIAGSFSTSWNTGLNHHISVHERIQGGTVTESANVMTVEFTGLGTDLILEIRVNPGNNFIEVQQVGGAYTGDIKMAFHITRFFD